MRANLPNAVTLVVCLAMLIPPAMSQEQPPPVAPITETVEESPVPALSEEPKPELERPTVWGE